MLFVSVSLYIPGSYITILYSVFVTWNRKRGLLLAGVIGIIGAAFMGTCKMLKTFELLIIGRFVIGVNCGKRVDWLILHWRPTKIGLLFNVISLRWFLLFWLNTGLYTSLSPMYVSELAPINLRGGLGTVNQLAVTVGLLLSQVLGIGNILGNTEGWHILLGNQMRIWNYHLNLNSVKSLFVLLIPKGWPFVPQLFKCCCWFSVQRVRVTY